MTVLSSIFKNMQTLSINDFCSFRRVIWLLSPCLNCYVFLHLSFLLPRDAMHPRYYSHDTVSLRQSVRLSVTSRSSTKTAKRRITQTTPYDGQGTLEFCSQRSPRNSTEVIPYVGAKCRLGGSKSATLDK